MSNYDLEQKQMDAVTYDLRWASILETVGWVLLVFDSIPVTMVWVGFRSGTYFWLYWTIIEGAVGFGLTAIGAYLRSKAGRHITRLGYEREEQKAA